MKTKEIAKSYGIDQKVFEYWLKAKGYPVKSGMTGMSLEDGQDIGAIVSEFQTAQSNLQAQQAEEAAAQEAAAQAKQAAMARMLITSGFNFDGYTITRYSGYISGDDAVSIDRGTHGFFSSATDVGDSLMAALVQIRRNALAELKEAAYALGCNAVIGVDFDYLTLDPETANSSGGTTYLPYVFGVTANGNAVVIEESRGASDT